jgi:hypothetical protein
VKVHHDEGLATRIGPKPCAGTREGDGEASAGERAGQPLSRDSLKSWVPTAWTFRKATQTSALCECSSGPAWSETLACKKAPCTGTGRSLDWPPALRFGSVVRGGKTRSRSRQ